MRHEDQLPGFAVDVVSKGAAVVVVVAGEVDIYTAPRMAEALEQAVTHAPRPLVVDLSAVKFFDSSGLNVLLRGMQAEAELRVVASPVVRRLVEVTGLTTVLRIFDRVDDAITATGDISDHR
ncbi:STAS domain-containing protein [Nocardia brasiliensis]|uniref:STAS domain-containing protein n=1 Tax=Nocardia brasiliensis TaxID=37326 RepID=UPI0024547087|nr:STAS domain-containing protein [Nocardia brasiliensis]